MMESASTQAGVQIKEMPATMEKTVLVSETTGSHDRRHSWQREGHSREMTSVPGLIGRL